MQQQEQGRDKGFFFILREEYAGLPPAFFLPAVIPLTVPFSFHSHFRLCDAILSCMRETLRRMRVRSNLRQLARGGE
jgi:hypothetical protein